MLVLIRALSWLLLARPRLVLARHPVKPSWDAFWVVGGRVADWGPLAGAPEVVRRTREVLARPQPRSGPTSVPVEEVDEVRIVASWLAGHDAPALPLEEAAIPERLEPFLATALSGGGREAAAA